MLKPGDLTNPTLRIRPQSCVSPVPHPRILIRSIVLSTSHRFDSVYWADFCGATQVSERLPAVFEQIDGPQHCARLCEMKPLPVTSELAGIVEPWSVRHACEALSTGNSYCAGGVLCWVSMSGRPQDAAWQPRVSCTPCRFVRSP